MDLIEGSCEIFTYTCSLQPPPLRLISHYNHPRIYIVKMSLPTVTTIPHRHAICNPDNDIEMIVQRHNACPEFAWGVRCWFNNIELSTGTTLFLFTIHHNCYPVQARIGALIGYYRNRAVFIIEACNYPQVQYLALNPHWVDLHNFVQDCSYVESGGISMGNHNIPLEWR